MNRTDGVFVNMTLTTPAVSIRADDAVASRWVYDVIDDVTTNISSATYATPNESYTEDFGFFRNYYGVTRFTTETTLAVFAIATNLAAFILTKDYHHRHYAYYALFKNLAMANLLAALSSWFGNNTLFLFSSNLGEWNNFCQVMLLLLSAGLVHMVFGIAAAVLLLGFSVVQFLAVSQPLRYDHLVTVTKVRVALVGVWVTCSAVALIPIIAYFVQFGGSTGCSTGRMRYIEMLTTTGANVCVDLLMVIYVTIVALCLRIYVIIRQLQRRLSTSVHSWQNDVHYERRTFQSIVVLVVTMTVFTVPYCIVYVVTMNVMSDNMANNTAILYYMNLLPYFKFASDPLIYRRGVTQLKSDLKKVLRSCRCRMGRHQLRLRRLPAFRQRRLYSKRVNLYLGNSNKNCRVTTV